MAAISLVGCGNSGEEKTTLKVGATAVPHAEILEQAKPLLKEKGIELDVVTCQDYVLPNTTLDEGELDANYFQHIPYLEGFNEEHGTHLVNAGGSSLSPPERLIAILFPPIVCMELLACRSAPLCLPWRPVENTSAKRKSDCHSAS